MAAHYTIELATGKSRCRFSRLRLTISSWMAGLRFRAVLRWGLISVSFLFFVFVTLGLVVISAASLLLEAKRNSTSGQLDNLKALYIGLAYVVTAVACLIYFALRRRDVQRKLSKIPRMYVATRQEDIPSSVHKFIVKEHLRSAAILYASQPTDGHQDGWGEPGTDLANVRFRRRLLDTVAEVDAVARTIVPRLPPMRPQARVLHHLRALAPLVPTDASGGSCLRRYDACIERARYAHQEPTEEEFLRGMQAADEVIHAFGKYLVYPEADADAEAESQDEDEDERDANALDEDPIIPQRAVSY